KDVLSETEREVRYRRQVGCPDCNGTGVEGGGEAERCEQCGGSGAVIRTQQTFIGSVRTQTICPVCGGTGSIIRNPCHKCKGRKQVVEEAKLSVGIPSGVESGVSMRVA